MPSLTAHRAVSRRKSRESWNEPLDENPGLFFGGGTTGTDKTGRSGQTSLLRRILRHHSSIP